MNTWTLTLEADEQADEVELLTDAVCERIDFIEENAAQLGREAAAIGDNGEEVKAALLYEAERLRIVLMRLELLQD
jgi:hypothetical protein